MTKRSMRLSYQRRGGIYGTEMLTVVITLLLLSCLISTQAFRPPSQCFSSRPRRQNRQRSPLIAVASSSSFSENDTTESLNSATMLTSGTSTVSAICTSNNLSRQDAETVIDTDLFPQKKYGERIGYGKDAQGLSLSEPVKADDPRMAFTYGEFPLSSFDALVDLALPFVEEQREKSNGSDNIYTMVDVGSGCGRLGLYAALSRPGWNIHGVEISNLLHSEAVVALGNGIDKQMFSWKTDEEDQEDTTEEASVSSSVYLHEGPADEFKTSVLSKVDILFAYSTAFASDGFSEKMGAMLIGNEWSSLFAESCKQGCVAITTDRALDPSSGWELVDRLEVENREVFGSTGYVHVLRKNE